MEENIPFPTPSRKVDFLGIKLYGSPLRVTNGEREALFLDRKTRIFTVSKLFPFHSNISLEKGKCNFYGIKLTFRSLDEIIR